jgi:hypothetical protein
VDLEVPDRRLRFVIGNLGQAPAYRVSVLVHRNLVGLRDQKEGMRSLPLTKTGLAYLAPGRTLKWDLGMYDFNRDADELDMTIQYENASGRTFERKVRIDMSAYHQILFESFRDPMRDVARAIKESERDRRPYAAFSAQPIEILGRRCVMCAEKIHSSAKKCSHCGELQAARTEAAAEAIARSSSVSKDAAPE